MKKEYFLKIDMVERKETRKLKDETLSLKAIEGRKLQTEKAVLEDRFVSPSKSVVQKSYKAGKKRE